MRIECSGCKEWITSEPYLILQLEDFYQVYHPDCDGYRDVLEGYDE